MPGIAWRIIAAVSVAAIGAVVRRRRSRILLAIGIIGPATVPYLWTDAAGWIHHCEAWLA